MILKYGLRASSVTERPCNTYKLIMMANQKSHEGNIFSRTDLKRIFYKNETTFTFEKPEMVMGSWLRPNIFHMINGLN